MLVSLFFVSFCLSLGIAAIWAGPPKSPSKGSSITFPINAALAMSKCLRLAMAFIGVSSGARIQLLEEFIAASPANKIEMNTSLTQEFWVTELYRGAVRSVEGILWLLLFFSLIVFVAYLAMRKTSRSQANGQISAGDSKANAD